MKLFQKITIILFVLFLLSVVMPKSHGATNTRPSTPILVIDKCPEFCQKPPVQMCAQVMIPVPGRPGYWYTDSCRKNIVGDTNKKCLVGVVNGRGYMPTIDCMKYIRERGNINGK
jgi:hypothetical protein